MLSRVFLVSGPVLIGLATGSAMWGLVASDLGAVGAAIGLGCMGAGSMLLALACRPSEEVDRDG